MECWTSDLEVPDSTHYPSSSHTCHHASLHQAVVALLLYPLRCVFLAIFSCVSRSTVVFCSGFTTEPHVSVSCLRYPWTVRGLYTSVGWLSSLFCLQFHLACYSRLASDGSYSRYDLIVQSRVSTSTVTVSSGAMLNALTTSHITTSPLPGLPDREQDHVAIAPVNVINQQLIVLNQLFTYLVPVPICLHRYLCQQVQCHWWTCSQSTHAKQRNHNKYSRCERHVGLLPL